MELYMLHVLAMLPIVEFKFKSQISYQVNGNEFLNRVMGKNPIRILKNLKCFFGVKDPRLNITSSKIKPNHSPGTVLRWIAKLCSNAWKSDRNFFSKVITATSPR